MKDILKKIPIIGPFGAVLRRALRARPPSQVDSSQYWISRYRGGGNSGVGSYGALAEFKAEFLNEFVASHHVQTVIEFGCGDGNQLRLAQYPEYLGLDVSPEAVELCRRSFASDPRKRFVLVSDYRGEKAQLSLSLDVIYHLTLDDVYSEYMTRLFESAEQFVIIYSSDKDAAGGEHAGHVRHRQFSSWVLRYCPNWELLQRVNNKFPWNGDPTVSSFADFFVYRRKA